MLYPNNDMNYAQNQDTTYPGSYPNTVPQAVAGFNQRMMKLAEVFDPFIQASLIAHPRYWYNAIPRGAFPNFNGYIHETRVYRGGLQHYAGLSQWEDINPVASATNNPCVRGSYTTPGYAWERFEWSGKRAYWGSDPICVDSLKYTQSAQLQLSWILQTAADYGISLQEVWNRDFLIQTATTDANRGYIMSKTYDGTVQAPRFYYDPFVKFGAGGVAAATGITKPFIVFKADTEVEPLNFDVLDFLHSDLEVSCPTGAVGSDGGSPMFSLPLSKFDFERYIKGNDYELANWREARANDLIIGVTNVKSHRGWALPFDGNQLRFKIKKVVSNYNSETYGGVGEALDGETVIIAEFVPPRIPGRVGEDSQQIPEWNPDYEAAELAVSPIHLNKVFTNLMGSDVTTLGSGTFFGPQPGLNGNWKWRNIITPDTNPDGKIGNFAGAYEIFPRPEPHVVFSTAFLYRRCTQSIRSRCPIDNPDVNPDTATGTSADALAYAAAGADVTAQTFMVDAALAKTLVDVLPGAKVSLTFNLSGGSSPSDDQVLTGYLVQTKAAPRYSVLVQAGTTVLAADDQTADRLYVDATSGKLTKVTGKGATTDYALASIAKA